MYLISFYYFCKIECIDVDFNEIALYFVGIIKFKEICMIKEPIEQIISIPVIRDEKFSDKETNVSWKTIDKTAISGTHYVGSSGEIIFNQGDTSKDIQIQILKSADATGDLRFTVELDHDGLFTPKPVTVSLKKIESKFLCYIFELFSVIFSFFNL